MFITVAHDHLYSITAPTFPIPQKFGDIIIDREKIKMLSSRYRGSVRMASRLFYSNNEYEEWR
jgi:hypothetical protein